MFKAIALIFSIACIPAAAEPVRTPHVTAELVSEFESVRPGEAAWVALRLETKPHWHTYWQFPGDSGLPTRAQWKIPEGWKISDIHWPLPERIPLPPLLNLGYEEQALLLFRLEVPASAAGTYDLSAKANWLVCKEECVPEQADLTLRLNVSPAAPRALPLRAAFEKVRSQQPMELPAGAVRGIRVEEKRVGLVLAGEAVGSAELDFFPLIAQVVTGHAPRAERAGEDTILWMEKAVPFAGQTPHLEGVLVQKHGTVFAVKAPMAGGAVSAAGVQAGAVRPSLLLSVLFAFLGGVLLNLMPCVFPVLGIKVMSLVSQGGADRWHSRVHGKIYALGVLASFWVLTALLLALRAAGESVGWGFQLQSPGFVLFLIYLFSLLTLNLAGAFEIGGRWVGMGSGLANRDGYAGSFFTGVLAVVVATPCTAPFMGTAISVVLAEPAWAVLVVFSSLALGLAAPFVLLAYQPKLLARMPKPGLWMARLKELLAFPLAATVLWLLWVLGHQKGVDAAMAVAFAVLLLTAAIWARRFRSLLGRIAMVALIVLSLATGGALVALPGLSAGGSRDESASKDWAPYSEEALAAARAEGRPVFVDFTAAWCLTCQVNKAVVLDRAGMMAFFRERNVALFRGDWTNNDPVITAALERQGRIGVPVYLVYRPGEEAKLLPQILTESIVRNAF